jgi:hypothetical protein
VVRWRTTSKLVESLERGKDAGLNGQESVTSSAVALSAHGRAATTHRLAGVALSRRSSADYFVPLFRHALLNFADSNLPRGRTCFAFEAFEPMEERLRPVTVTFLGTSSGTVPTISGLLTLSRRADCGEECVSNAFRP